VKRAYRHVGTNEKPDGDKTTYQDLATEQSGPNKAGRENVNAEEAEARSMLATAFLSGLAKHEKFLRS
jgi:hypothetical protein